jgi:hypothetical protein
MADERHLEDGQQFPIGLAVRSLKELRPHTGLDEKMYRGGPHVNPARGFILYSLLDEAEMGRFRRVISPLRLDFISDLLRFRSDRLKMVVQKRP